MSIRKTGIALGAFPVFRYDPKKATGRVLFHSPIVRSGINPLLAV